MTLPLRSGIDFCICTFNRVDYLKMNINALLPQLVPGKSVISVVDNNSTDGTKVFMQSLSSHDSVRYIVEEMQGHSHARNRGWKDSGFEWIFYIDDD